MGSARKLAAAQIPTARGRSASVKSTGERGQGHHDHARASEPEHRPGRDERACRWRIGTGPEPAPNKASALSITFLRP